MKDENNKFLKTYMVDHSNDRQFRFSMNCPICAKRYDSIPIAISAKALSEGYVGKTYQDERIWAQDEAACQAAEQFDRCPICGKPICRGCIVTCEDLTMCKSCLSLLQDRIEKKKSHSE